MPKFVIFLALFTLFSKVAYAKAFGVQVVGFWNTNRVFRGAQTLNRANGLIAPGFVLWEKLFLRGPNVIYSFFPDRKSPIEFEFSANYMNDDEPPGVFGDYVRDYRNQRRDALEIRSRFRYKFGFRNKFYLGALVAKELIDYEGLYSELQAGAPLLPFTSLNLAMSYAEKSTNKYIYGPDRAVSGVGYARAGVTLAMPFVPWDGIALVNYDHFWVLQDGNQLADYVRGNDTQNNFSIRLIWNAY